MSKKTAIIDQWETSDKTYSLGHSWSFTCETVYIGLHGERVVTWWDYMPNYQKTYWANRIANHFGWPIDTLTF